MRLRLAGLTVTAAGTIWALACSPKTDSNGGNDPVAAGGQAGMTTVAVGGSSGAATGGASTAGSAGDSSPGPGGGGAGTAGASTGGGGAAQAGGGGSGGMPADMVTLAEEDGLHVLRFGEIEFVVDTTTGARIVSYRLGTSEVLTGPDANAQFYGSTLWTAPESDWAAEPFIPPEELDVDAYTATVEGTTLSTVSQSFTVAGKELGAEKQFSIDPADGAVVIQYSLLNVGASPFDIAPWEVTRVPPDGLGFYPAGMSQETLYGPLEVQQMGDYFWMDHSQFPAGDPSKNAGDAGSGWVAYVVPDDAGDLLFVKAFTNVAADAPAPNHGEIELYADPDRNYVEVEIHGAFVTLAPGARLDWEVRWYLTRLSPDLARVAGAAEFPQAVEALLP